MRGDASASSRRPDRKWRSSQRWQKKLSLFPTGYEILPGNGGSGANFTATR